MPKKEKEMAKGTKHEKKKMATDIKIFIIVCVIVTIILGSAIVYIVMPKDIAVVKNNKISNAEFSYYYSKTYQQYYYYYLLGLFGNIDEQTLISYTKQQALSSAAEVEYLLQEAEKEGFSVSKEDMDAAWNEVDSSLKADASKNGISLNALCKSYYGVKYDQLRSIYKDIIKAEKYREKVYNDRQANEEELKAYYEEKKDSFDYNTVRHILIRIDENAEDSVVEEKKKTAQSILDRVNNGEDFAELAKKYSEDDGSKDNGGLYNVQKGDMVKEFEDWTFSHNVGDTGLIKTDYGFHVMKLEGITNTFDALKDAVEDSYKEEKYYTSLQEVLNGEYKIEVKDAYYNFKGI